MQFNSDRVARTAFHLRPCVEAAKGFIEVEYTGPTCRRSLIMSSMPKGSNRMPGIDTGVTVMV